MTTSRIWNEIRLGTTSTDEFNNKHDRLNKDFETQQQLLLFFLSSYIWSAPQHALRRASSVPLSQQSYLEGFQVWRNHIHSYNCSLSSTRSTRKKHYGLQSNVHDAKSNHWRWSNRHRSEYSSQLIHWLQRLSSSMNPLQFPWHRGNLIHLSLEDDCCSSCGWMIVAAVADDGVVHEWWRVSLDFSDCRCRWSFASCRQKRSTMTLSFAWRSGCCFEHWTEVCQLKLGLFCKWEIWEREK